MHERQRENLGVLEVRAGAGIGEGVPVEVRDCRARGFSGDGRFAGAVEWAVARASRVAREMCVEPEGVDAGTQMERSRWLAGLCKRRLSDEPAVAGVALGEQARDVRGMTDAPRAWRVVIGGLGRYTVLMQELMNICSALRLSGAAGLNAYIPLLTIASAEPPRHFAGQTL